MRLSALLQLFPALALAGSLETFANSTSDCKVIPGDAGWPSDTVWTTELKGVERQAPGKWPHPQWRWEATKAEHVVTAINFVKKHNVRVSILNSGHDFDGRNDAPSGLLIVTRSLKGARILPSFTPTEKGAEPINSKLKINVLPKQKAQAYLTFGAGYNTKEITNLLAPSGLFALGAAHKSVSLAGGWGQTAGHAPLGNKYGLGADQFVEFKVVTPDGVLRVANAVANPDLFWALRGGGGGTFGVVVEATIKIYPSPNMATSAFYLNTTNFNDQKSVFPAAAYIHSQFPDLADKGLTAYYYLYENAISIFTTSSGEQGTKAWVDANWYPILKKAANFPGMNPRALYVSMEYPDYATYFKPQYDAMSLLSKRDYGAMFDKRHGPGDEDVVQTRGIICDYSDSWMLGREHLKSPDLAKVLAADFPWGTIGGSYRGQMVGGGMIHQLGNDTSVLPIWRKMYVHTIAIASGTRKVDNLRKLAPEMGAYVNEASRYQKNWRKNFWGDNYARLSEIKRKYDPEHMLWVTPGINAEVWEARNGRICRAQNVGANSDIFAATATAPLSDNVNLIPYPEIDNEGGPPFPPGFLGSLFGMGPSTSEGAPIPNDPKTDTPSFNQPPAGAPKAVGGSTTTGSSTASANPFGWLTGLFGGTKTS